MIGAFLFSFGLVLLGLSQDLRMHLTTPIFDDLILNGGGRTVYKKRAKISRKLSMAMMAIGLPLFFTLLYMPH